MEEEKENQSLFEELIPKRTKVNKRKKKVSFKAERKPMATVVSSLHNFYGREKAHPVNKYQISNSVDVVCALAQCYPSPFYLRGTYSNKENALNGLAEKTGKPIYYSENVEDLFLFILCQAPAIIEKDNEYLLAYGVYKNSVITNQGPITNTDLAGSKFYSIL